MRSLLRLQVARVAWMAWSAWEFMFPSEPEPPSRLYTAGVVNGVECVDRLPEKDEPNPLLDLMPAHEWREIERDAMLPESHA